MSAPPDQSRLTACLLGEATPAEQSAFDSALLSDLILREEAASTTRAAQRLALALKQEAPVFLTPIHRQNILGHDRRHPLVTARRLSGAAWLAPTLATAGIAAALTLAVYTLPDFDSKRSNSTSDGGIPVVSIKPGPPPAKPASRPALPLPALGRKPASQLTAMPDTAFPAGPVRIENQNAMTAMPPVITIVPNASNPDEPDMRVYSSPAPSALGKNSPGESRSRSAPRKP